MTKPAWNEKTNIIRLVREYCDAVPCSCVQFTTCWRCTFQYNLQHLDAARVLKDSLEKEETK